MIKFTLDRVMFENGNIKIPRLQKLSGVNKNTLYAFYNGSITRFDVSVLLRICAALNCQPGDLLQYIPGEEIEHVKKPQAVKRKETISPAEDANYTIDDDEEGPGV